jgi:hypothetical protein
MRRKLRILDWSVLTMLGPSIATPEEIKTLIQVVLG